MIAVKTAYITVPFYVPNQTFDSMKEVTTFVVDFVNKEKERFLYECLDRNGINAEKSKMGWQELVDKHKVELRISEKTERLFVGERQIGVWKRETPIEFTQDGKMYVKVKYKYT